MHKARRTFLLVGLASLALGLLPVLTGAGACNSKSKDKGTRFYVPAPDKGAVTQIKSLIRKHDFKDAALIAKMANTAQAVWLNGGTKAEVKKQVKKTMWLAHAQHAVPVFVAYDLPFRDCGQYSSGGALDTAAYEAWIDGIAAGIGNGKASLLLEPDGLGIIPYNTDANGVKEWCKPDLTGTGLTPATANAARYTQLNYAVDKLGTLSNLSVYLDGGHSAWLGVGDIADRLVKAGVNETAGFFLNASNYQYTPNLIQYGTWISKCIALGSPYTGCANQYWNGGPTGSMIATLLGAWTGVALSPYGVWSDTSTNPALNTSGYAGRFGSAVPTTHFVIDTSRNALGPNNMSTYAAAPYNQPAGVISALASGNWCNNPASGLGLRPTTNTGNDLLDAYLWVKIPGASDGQCDSAGGARAWDYSAYTKAGWPTVAGQQALFDPLWGLVDPAAGAWFPQMALQLVHAANPPLH